MIFNKLKIIYFSLFFLLLTATTSQAGRQFDKPQLTIQGAEEPIPQGEIVILTVSPLGPKPDFLKTVQYDWRVIENGKLKQRIIAWHDNTKLIFGASDPKSKIYVILNIAYYFEVMGENNKLLESALLLDTQFAEVKIKPWNPGPGPGPDPEPDPNPPEPGPYLPDELSKQIYSWTSKITLGKELKVKACHAIAGNFESIASSIAAGAIRDLRTALAETKKANDNTLKQYGFSANSFDEFSKNLQQLLFDRYKAGSLNSPEQIKEAWNSIAIGLKGVK